MMMMIDAFEVEGVTELAVDSIFMMPHLGVLSTVHPAAATEVFEKDCLVRLGTCVAPVGRARGALCSIELKLPGGDTLREELAAGALRKVDLAADQTAHLVVQPARGVDVGAGPGQRLEREVRGGVVGLVFDARGRRPLPVAATPAQRVANATRRNDVLDLYPVS